MSALIDSVTSAFVSTAKMNGHGILHRVLGSGNLVVPTTDIGCAAGAAVLRRFALDLRSCLLFQTFGLERCFRGFATGGFVGGQGSHWRHRQWEVMVATPTTPGTGDFVPWTPMASGRVQCSTTLVGHRRTVTQRPPRRRPPRHHMCAGHPKGASSGARQRVAVFIAVFPAQAGPHRQTDVGGGSCFVSGTTPSGFAVHPS